MKHFIQHSQQGMVMIALMIFMVVGISITVAAVGLVIDATVASSSQISGESALAIAESGAENAILRILRAPTYSGEVLPVGNGTATITVTGAAPMVIRSVSQIGIYSRAVEVRAQRVSGRLTIVSWQEVSANP